MSDHLQRNGNLVDSLGSALRSGEHGLSTVPALINRVLDEGSWREFITKRGEVVPHERFIDFVTTPPLKGLGGDIVTLRRIVKGTVAEGPLEGQLKEDGRQGARTDLFDNIQEVKAPTGTARSASLRRLKKDAPELHSDVLAGSLSAHAAMVKAGFRPKTVSVPVTRPEAVAKSLLKYMSADDIAKLIAVLLGREGSP